MTETPLTIYIDVPEQSDESSFTVYNVYEETDESRFTPHPRDNEDRESDCSDLLLIKTTRSCRPPLRFGIDEYVVNPK